jgi:hypothetical protein
MKRMSKSSVTEIVKRKRKDYKRASREEKGRILNELEELTGYHRKSLGRLLRQSGKPKQPIRRSRKVSQYAEVLPQLRTLWAASFYACGKRLAPFLSELVPVMTRFGEIQVTAEQEALLGSISPATVDRLLKRDRAAFKVKGRTTTKPGTLLRSQIAVRTFAEWDEHEPGFFEMDLVAHCGSTTKGEFHYTLDMTDILTGWTVLGAMKGRGERGTLEAMKASWEQVPFAVKGIDSDNDSAFINNHLLRYCRSQKITFTRCRPYRKNDQCHVEQKNWSLVRQFIGYRRFETDEQLAILKQIHPLLSKYHNFFAPMMRLLCKERNGSKVSKKYDVPMTPYQRAMALEGGIDETVRERLKSEYESTNPAELLRRITALLKKLGET